MPCKGRGAAGEGESFVCMSVFTLTDKQLLRNTASMCERGVFLLCLLLRLWTVFMPEGTLAEEDEGK